LVEIAQGRQPCWKIDHHFGVHGMTAAVITTGRCGLYFRVIEEGLVSAGDALVQLERAPHDWTVARTFRLLIAGGHREEGVMDGLVALAEMAVLADSWRIRAAQLALSLGKK
jgi:MOSC domain-containing protein YiiM